MTRWIHGLNLGKNAETRTCRIMCMGTALEVQTKRCLWQIKHLYFFLSFIILGKQKMTSYETKNILSYFCMYNVVKLLLPILKPECSRAVHSVYKSSNIVRRLFLLQENGAICLPSPVVEMITQEEKNGHKKCNLNMALLLFHIQNN